MTEGDGGRLDDLFEDLEQQAVGLDLAERDAELLDRARGEYAAVTLADRVHASVGREVAVTLVGGEVLAGILTAAGSDWCALAAAGGPGTWLVRLEAVGAVRGLSPRSLPERVRPAVSRLGFGSALHRAAETTPGMLVRLTSGRALRVQVRRVGADFLEAGPVAEGAVVDGSAESAVVLAFPAIEAVRTGGT